MKLQTGALDQMAEMTIYVSIMPRLSGPLVCALLYDGLCTFEFGIVAEIFGLRRPELGANWYRFASCSMERKRMRAAGGLMVTATNDLRLTRKADIVVIPGWRGPAEPVPRALCEALLYAHNRGARIVSICSGAFVLAATGLLSGATATTHWRYAEELKRRFPDIDVDASSLYQKHGRVYTSAGSAAGIDLLIEIVREDFGAGAANSVARRLVMPAHRSGGQAQFLERPVAIHEGAQIAPLLEKIRKNLALRWEIRHMASECHMSVRTFARRFYESTGQTPGDWLISQRIAEAQQLLRQNKSGIEAIASAVGFGSAYTLRVHFRKRLGLSPLHYRSRFLSEESDSRRSRKRLQYESALRPVT